MKLLFSMLSRSQLRSIRKSQRAPALPEVLGLLTTPMAYAMANEFDVLPGRSFRPSSKPFPFTLTSLNHRPSGLLLMSDSLCVQHTPKIVTCLDSPAPTRACRPQSRTTQAHLRTFQGIPTLTRTKNLARLKKLSPRIRTSPHFSLTITSGRVAHPSPGTTEMCCRP